jgi:hypothetical protein
MRITRLYLRNFRVYEDELDLHLPAGLVGIYGPNGGGKCLPANTRVWDGDTGEALSIERFVNERRKHLIGFTAGKASVVPVSDWHVLGARPTVTVAHRPRLSTRRRPPTGRLGGRGTAPP